FYKSISLFPLALPIAVLLAGVMVLGNLAERFELSSFKSAGVSLTRLLSPLVVVSALIGLFSFYCSNTIIPIANLKYQSRLYDIRNQKPTLSIEPGVFNEDFGGYSIRVGKKLKDKESIEDIMVYDDTQRNRGQLNLVTARKGKMYVSKETGAFVMTLYDGYQYSEVDSRERPNSLPFTITHFNEWTRQFDLSEFDLDRTEEEQFKSHHLMKSARQIAYEIDTLDEQIALTKTTGVTPYKLFQATAAAPEYQGFQYIDTIANTSAIKKRVREIRKINSDSIIYSLRRESIMGLIDTLNVTTPTITESLPQSMKKTWKTQMVIGLNVQETTVDRTDRSIDRLELTRRKHLYELHWKFSLAAACIVMLMIGGPMGTIVRKGGFGYPLLVSIFFFTFFIMSNISCKKLNDSETLNPVLAAWLPVIMLGAISAFLTYKALNDAKIMDMDRIRSIFIRLTRRAKASVA
ncbi:MAG: LptF/LptG family permease, partial [Saprospiraceae bacterium]